MIGDGWLVALMPVIRLTLGRKLQQRLDGIKAELEARARQEAPAVGSLNPGA